MIGVAFLRYRDDDDEKEKKLLTAMGIETGKCRVSSDEMFH